MQVMQDESSRNELEEKSIRISMRRQSMQLKRLSREEGSSGCDFAGWSRIIVHVFGIMLIKPNRFIPRVQHIPSLRGQK